MRFGIREELSDPDGITFPKRNDYKNDHLAPKEKYLLVIELIICFSKY